MKNILIKLAKFERYKNISALNSAVMIKLFLANLVNTGILIVIINANYSAIGLPNLLSGEFSDLS